MDIYGNNTSSSKAQHLPVFGMSTKFSTGKENLVPDSLRWVYFAIGTIGIVDNGIVVVVMLVSRHLRRRSANLVIVNQSLIDGLASLFLVAIMVPYLGTPNLIACKFWLNRMPLWCLLLTSTYNILCLALERHLAILYPLWHKASLTKNKMVLLLLFPWIFGVGFNAAFAIPTSVFVNGTCLIYEQWPNDYVRRAFGILVVHVEYIIPILLQIYLYGRIIYVLRHRSQTGPFVSTSNPTGHTDRGTQHDVNQTGFSWSRAQKNSLKTAAIVSICFVLCWTCDQVYFLMYFLQQDETYDVSLFSYLLLPVVANSCLNPFIYALQYESFQTAFRKLCCRYSGQEQTSSTSNARTNVMQMYNSSSHERT